jgi:hypothetical protein
VWLAELPLRATASGLTSVKAIGEKRPTLAEGGVRS